MSLSGFLSRRRAGLRAEAEAEARALERPIDEAAPSPEAQAPEAVEPSLPDPETLVAGDDFAAFMGRTVSAQLRTQALRKLWRTNPVLACVDGLNDYDDDYRAMAAGQGPLKTTYEVGRGLKRHVERLARLDAEAALEAETAPHGADVADPAPDTDPAPLAAAEESHAAPANTDWHPAAPVEESVEPSRSAPRRMRFADPETVA